MTSSRYLISLALASCLVAFSSARAQQNDPRIGYVYPAGARQGASLQIAIGGQFLDSATGIHVTGGGVRATFVEHTKPLTPGQFTILRERLKELLDKRAAAEQSLPPSATRPSTRPTWTADDEKMLADVRKKLANPPRRQGNPAIADTVTFQLVVAPDAEPGQREIRVVTATGLTNPLVFHVGQLPEFSKPLAKPGPELLRSQQQVVRSGPEMLITVPVVANGQIMPGGVDRFRFKATKGQRLVAAVSARSLIPYLADAVPGWFQATLALYDSKGVELAYADDYRFNPDPVITCQIPEDGEYIIEIKDAIYRGREDFVYRIAIGQLPFVASVFPLGSRIGSQPVIELNGWNLSAARITQDMRGKASGVYPLFVGKDQPLGGCVPFALDTLPECFEQEPNNAAQSAQAVSLPIIVNGRIHQPSDIDIFRFEARANDQIVAEVHARRLNSPLDSCLKLTDSTGRQIAFNDDHEDKAAGLTTHHADSYLRATIPETGVYCLQLSDTQRKGGSEYAYRLRVSPPRPDFDLRIAPSSINLRAGATIPITVFALRKDGFAGDIELSLKNAPIGFFLGGNRVPAGQDQVRLTLSVSAISPNQTIPLQIEGRATIHGREVSHPVVPADDMMQAFAYRHLVPAQQLLVTVAGRIGMRNPPRVLTPGPIRIVWGGTARIRVATPAGAFQPKMRFELNEPPEGITLQSASPTREGVELVVQADSAKVKTGLRGTLILDVLADRPNTAQNPQANRRRLPITTLPAIPFEVVAK